MEIRYFNAIYYRTEGNTIYKKSKTVTLYNTINQITKYIKITNNTFQACDVGYVYKLRISYTDFTGIYIKKVITDVL